MSRGLPKWNERTTITNTLKKYHKRKDHKSYFVYGPKGSGKSTWSILSSYSFYKDWDKVFKYMVFSRQELLNIIRECFDFENKRVIKRIPVLIWDDATFENIRTQSQDAFIEEFSKFYTLVRSVVSNFIWTSPNFTLLPSKLKSMDWVLVRISRINEPSSKAHFYMYNQMPNGRIYLKSYRVGDRKIEETYYLGWLPKTTRERYEIIRDGYSIDGFLQLEKAYKLQEKQKFNTRKIVDNLSKRLKYQMSKDDVPITAIVKKSNKKSK